MRLRARHTLVVGAARGIGRAIAERFALEGARVSRTARDPSQLPPLPSPEARGIEAALDVTQPESVQAALAQVWDQGGPVDVLVHCPGIIQYDTPVWKTRLEDFDSMLKINLRGTFLVCQDMAARMVERGQGKLITLASSSARMADDDLGAYTASKWAVAGYTTSLARSLRPHGVQVNGLNPGWVDTEMSRAYQKGGDPSWSTPEEIAASALFLAAEAPRDMTGQFLDIFGS